MLGNRFLLLGALGALLAACGSSAYYGTAAVAPTASRGLEGSANGGEALSLDGVTNGLRDNASANPLAGAFFDDGKDADRRGGRAENVFGEPLASPQAAGAERMLVYHGTVKVEVARPDEAIEAFLAQVTAWGGYLQAQVDDAVTVRLPAAHFDAAMALLRAAGRVLQERQQADDVTEEFVDLGIRLDNAKRSRDRLLEILARAEKVEDILAVEKELRRLTEEIERMEGRRKFLADQVAMATLQAVFQGVVEAPDAKRRRRPSRFYWINLVGAERVMEDF